jgi:hypothetical protein
MNVLLVKKQKKLKNNKGQIMIVGICNSCKERKEKEAQIKPTPKPSDGRSMS